MKSSLTAGFLGLVLLIGAAPAFAHGPGHNPSRHDYVMRHGVPQSYRRLLNPLQVTSENLSAGKSLYTEHCATCHGAAGAGDGEAAADLDPRPPTLAGMYERPMAGMGAPNPGGHMMHGMMHHHPGMTHAEAMGGLNLDAYSYWAVSEGGEPMGGSMPAFKEILTEKERWQTLLYIANGFSIEVRR